MITPRTPGRFAFPGIGHFIDRAGESLSLDRALPADALAIDGARRSSHMAAVAANISGAASTSPEAVASVLALGETHLRSLRLELRAAEDAYAAAHEAAGLERPGWLSPPPAPEPEPGEGGGKAVETRKPRRGK